MQNTVDDFAQDCPAYSLGADEGFQACLLPRIPKNNLGGNVTPIKDQDDWSDCWWDLDKQAWECP